MANKDYWNVIKDHYESILNYADVSTVEDAFFDKHNVSLSTFSEDVDYEKIVAELLDLLMNNLRSVSEDDVIYYNGALEDLASKQNKAKRMASL